MIEPIKNPILSRVVPGCTMENINGRKAVVTVLKHPETGATIITTTEIIAEIPEDETNQKGKKLNVLI